MLAKSSNANCAPSFKAANRLLALAITLIATFSFHAQAEVDRDKYSEMWRTTPLNQEYAIELLKSKNCLENADSLYGCFLAVKTLASITQQDLVAHGTRVELTQASPEEKRLASQNKSFRSVYQEMRTKQNAEAAQVYATYNNRMAAVALQNSLVATAKALFAKLPDKNDEAMIVGTMFNQYLGQRIDPHTAISPKAFFEVEHKEGGSTDFVGIGISVHILNGEVVVNPMEDGPAAKAGLQRYDRITHVDDTPVAELTPQQLTAKIQGPKDSKVKLTIQRGCCNRLDVAVTRSPIKIKNVTSSISDASGRKVGVVRLRSFIQENACEHVKRAVLDLQNANVSGLVLDLRGNGGGLLTQAVCIAGLFVDKGSSVVEVRPVVRGAPHSIFKTDTEPVSKLPLAVLIDGNSASASELLAGALQDNGRAWIVGERSFGKGTVQAVMDFTVPNTVISQTIQVFFQPNGRTNQVYGILPDIEVPFKKDATEDERFALREADIYPNAILVGPDKFEHPRPEALVATRNHVAKNGVADKVYRADGVGDDGDYQLLKAIDAIGCCDNFLLP